MARPDVFGTTSDSNDSLDDENGSEQPVKRNKSTYQMRREELEYLREEFAALQAKIQVLETVHEETPKFALEQSVAQNTQLNAQVKVNDLAFAAAQAMISTASQIWNPISHYIHLPRDASQRHQTLLGLLPAKAEACVGFLRERTRFLDIRQPHRQVETTVLPNGDFVMTLFDITPFDGLYDVRAVWGQVLEYTATQEIRLSEELGVITIREVDDSSDSSASQHRFLACIAPGVQMESNSATFSGLVESADGLTPTFGFGVSDYVDQDDRHPYESSSRLRRDFTACCLAVETPPDLSSVHGNLLPGVSMIRSARARLHRPQFPISRSDEAAARAYIMQWPDVMIKTIGDHLRNLHV